MFVFVLVIITLCPFSFAIMLKSKREMVDLLLLSYRCLTKCSVTPSEGAVCWSAGVILVFIDHTHFLSEENAAS